MNESRVIVISDIHLGSHHVEIEHIVRFFRTLPQDVPLLLNGDIVDRVHHSLPDEHEAVLDMIEAASFGLLADIRDKHL